MSDSPKNGSSKTGSSAPASPKTPKSPTTHGVINSANPPTSESTPKKGGK